MKSFYGLTYIGKELLRNNNTYYPIRLEYYKTEKIKNFKSIYGIEVYILEQFKTGKITPIVAEEMTLELLKT